MLLNLKNIFALVFVLLIVFFVFRHSLAGDFLATWDDELFVNNVYVKSFDLKSIFSTSVLNVYCPLTLVSFALENRLWGQQPFVYHLNNLLLHLAVTGLVLLFSLKMGATLRAAFFASLLFGVHPMHVESVAWICERKDVLYSFFYMFSLVCYLDYVRGQKLSAYYLSLFGGFLSILSKPMALSLPLILLACDWFWGRFGRESLGKIIKEKIPYLLYIAPIAWISYSQFVQSQSRFSFDVLEGALVWVWSFVFYVQKFLLPFGLLPHYELPQPILWKHPAYIGSFLLFVIFIFGIVRFYKQRWFVFAWFYYCLSIFFILRFQNTVLEGNLSVVADRFMYLPSLGFCIFLGVCIDKLFGFCSSVFIKKLLCSVGVGLVFIALCAGTVFQSKIWKDDITLWRYVVERAPGDPLGYVNRALGYQWAGQYELAVADNARAIAIDPHYYVAVESFADKDKNRISDINAVLANNPFLVVAHRNRGLLYMKMGKPELAIGDFDAVLEIDPGDADIRLGRAAALADLRKQN